MLKILTASLLMFAFPRQAEVSGELYVAPDGNYVGIIELGEGRLLRLEDGWIGLGAWCGELVSYDGYRQVCGTGEVLTHTRGVRVRMRGPGVSVDDVAVQGDL